MAKTPRDVANEAERMVVALPQRMLGHLLSLSLEAGATRSGIEVVKRASGYLDERFEREFAEAAGGMPEALGAARRRLLEAVSTMVGSVAVTDREIAEDTIAEMARATEETLEPAVTAFLGALFDAVVAHERAAAKRAQDVDSSGLDQIDEIARKITFIAINASVEAARAGDVGAGFGVIAAEIKSLSQQAKKSIDRIRSELA